MASTSSSQGGAALTELMQLILLDQADDLRSRLTKMNQMKCEMEAKEDQDAVFDSLDGLMDTIKRDSDVLIVVTHFQELVNKGIREKENNVKFLNLAD
ncbi:hypothetical protein Tco_1463524 [Tanacetum coccineum]